MWRFALRLLAALTLLSGGLGCGGLSREVKIVGWHMNSVESIVQSGLDLISSHPGRAKDAQENLEKAVKGAILAQRPCSVTVTLRNDASRRLSFDPGSLRLSIQGQTFVPVEYRLAEALPLSPIEFAPGEERSGTVIFTPPIALANAADSAQGVQLSYDRVAARRRIASVKKPR